MRFREKEKLMGMTCGMERRIMQLQQQLATINEEKEIIIRNHAGKGEATHGARAWTFLHGTLQKINHDEGGQGKSRYTYT
jgi:hypothetical protein